MTLDRADAPPFAPRLRLMMCLAALAAAFAVSQSPPAHADRVTPPPVIPTEIRVPDGNKAFREGGAIGTQNYIRLPSASGFAWTLFGPQATLFDKHDEQIITHFLSPNPVENGTPRATWQDSEDTSKVWGMAIATSSDPHFVEPGAIPWLLLQVVGAQDGPTGGDELSETTYIQRVNTAEGLAPSTGCTLSTDLGTRALVPYSAEYFFYKATKHISSR